MELESMLELFIAGIVIVGSLISSAKKASARRVAEASRRPAPAPAAPAAAKPIVYTPAQPTVMPSMVISDVPAQAIVPTVHTHLQPDCDVHDAQGSLGYVSTEGKDPCHDDQLTHERTGEYPAPAESGLTLDWSGESMVKAFIMQEVLTRPAQRRAGQHN